MDLFLVLRILFALFLVGLNGLFVAAEFAFVRIRESTSDELYKQNLRGSKSLSIVVENLDDYLAVTQLGITVASLGLGWIGEPAFAGLVEAIIGTTLPSSTAHLIGFAVGFSTITFLHVVLGELVPKTLSIQLTEKICLFVAPIMRVFRFMFIPGIIVFNGTAIAITSFFGVPPARETDESHSEAEIRSIIESSKEQGLVDSDEEKMIKRVFEFDDTQLKQVMIPEPDVISIEKGSTVKEARDLMHRSNKTKIPIVSEDGNKVERFIDIRETINNEDDEASAESVGEDVLVLPEVTNLDKALIKMREQQYEMAVIVDEWGSFEGIVTIEDIVEEIVGDIRDKFDSKDNKITQRSDGVYTVSGKISLKRLKENLEINLESDEMDTLSGWLMENASSIPSKGDVFTKPDYEITVVETADNMVKEAEIKFITEEE